MTEPTEDAKTLTPDETMQRITDMSIWLLDGLAQKYVTLGLPAGLLARNMIAVGVSIIEGGEGTERALETLRDVSGVIVEKHKPTNTAH